MSDLTFMKIALRLSLKGLGYTEPNPLVGAVVVKGGRILSCGHHRGFGAPHAEAMALERLGVSGTTLYLTLEPCSHTGKTPPCADLIIARRVRRVVVAMIDPNPLVNGSGIARLRAAGIATAVGLCRDQAERINRHYLKYIRTHAPYVAIHAGLSLDGKLSDDAGRSHWVTSEELRRLAHSLRGEFSAIMAGSGTVRADDPLLTLREAGWVGKKLYRVVLDSQNALPRSLRIIRELDDFPLVIFSSRHAADRSPRTRHHYFVDSDGNGLDLGEVLANLGRLGIASVLVEGGGRLIDSFVRQRRFDEVVLFYAPKIVGGSGATRLAEALELRDFRLSELASGFILRGFRPCSPD
ncbi:MAG: bifunctional diaminohydroxyphosphoribosylaminopyrimidine deaminase/5-amino-6-(5-phosphoribosylamino)uracil reductase RibD [Candidatus Aminicenantes bacterium]|nr:bifunctional diaminohydroxyphosphoribosylaminopyrimidine deaminase/5-amino-6-(5-phosphoribosylamino)uracil reductase RibD [Candidatus Aminicenantes bacterium]